MLTRRGRAALSRRRALSAFLVWLLASTWLWSWWLSAADSSALWLYIPLTLAIAYEYALIPAAFLYFLFKARHPKEEKPLLDKRVAVITPCVPSQESLKVIERQLKALSKINYPHDSWILDDGGDAKVKQLAKKYKVRYFTRVGIDKYNQADYPFKAKTKAGNVNAWLDTVKKEKYHFFTQIDIDHVPTPGFLDKVLPHFRKPKVAWVQAPSIYRNLQVWTARGSAEQELGLNGPLQMGFYGSSNAPVVIGSHTTFRMSAIRQIKGFQQTRAEDHLNTLALLSKGWRGVYVPDVIAQGDGPETLAAYFSQQYAWAFSMFLILKTYSFRFLRKMTVRHKFQFLFLQTWYPLWSLSFLIMFLVPVVGLLTDRSAMHSDPAAFITRLVPVFASTLVMFWAAKPILQPQKLSLSWRGMILHVVRWPIILMAVCSALFGRQKPYQITPKGKFLRSAPTAKLYKPFLVLSLINTAAIFFASMVYGSHAPFGLMIFAGMNLVTMLSICLIDLHIRLQKVNLKRRAFYQYWLKPMAAVFGVLMLVFTSTISLISSNSQRISAIAPSPTTYTAKRNISTMPPQLLSDSELNEAIRAAFVSHSPPPSVGMHTPGVAPSDTEPYIRHTFVDWRERRHLAEELLLSLRAGDTPFITIEPKGEKNGTLLFQQIISGKHDKELTDVLRVMSLTNQTIYVRFAHEMDLADTYPWGARDPALFIAAYRHFHDLAKKEGVNNIKWVWGPAGTPQAADYYPGNDVVDVIGTTVLYDRYWNGDYKLSFYQMVENRLWLRQYGKPLWITELGIGKADQAYQSSLLKDGVDHFQDYGFSALLYLNIHDSNLAAPDYRFSSIEKLTKVLGIYKSPTVPKSKLYYSSRHIRKNPVQPTYLWRQETFDLNIFQK